MDPPLHERVYEGLKEDYLAGHFVPGKKIDIQDLATRHRSSKTPVREAAFILVGEGLLAHHSDGGFLVPVREPAELVELLAWHMQLMAATLTRLRETAMREALQQSLALSSIPSPVSVANLASDIFSSLAAATGNRQALIEVRRVNERLHYSRIADTIDPELAEKELVTIAGVDAANLPKATRRRIEAYHMRKIAHQQKLIKSSEHL
ncbi:GntR family transcriptional regulator [Sphingobium sp. H39-3-25]|uniref:GntR family transcriptional regulator n=1 Tax=Sphingobium arseniciresistens TaxID=3030834 RepID=UPI0023B9F0AC|nr:GntR family transcriptional regulator [Sphingobium arseniciresistens]